MHSGWKGVVLLGAAACFGLAAHVLPEEFGWLALFPACAAFIVGAALFSGYAYGRLD